MKEKNLTRIGLDVDDETLAAVKEIADRERWPVRRVAEVALENYIKARGHRKEEDLKGEKTCQSKT